ncbi:MAG TPA: SAM-dependent methyltransferase [Geobacter sp.]|nr:SAM-dependent methyltransferase [Geobacter sp.]
MTKTNSFDKHVTEYDAWFDEHRDLYLAELAAMRSFIPASGSGIEIGAGTGRFAAPLGIRTGIEPSPWMAQLARQRGVEVVEGRAEDLPFVDGSFDFAIMVTVVCFLDDIAQAFREVSRILRLPGTLVIGFIDRESELGRCYSQKKEHSRFYRDAIFYSVSELEELLANAGFSNFTFHQTLLPGEPTDLSVREGHGSGGFVVVQAHKT